MLLAVLLILISPFVAQSYDEPQVTPLVAAMSPQLLVQLATAPHYALVMPKMQFSRIAIRDAWPRCWAWLRRSHGTMPTGLTGCCSSGE